LGAANPADFAERVQASSTAARRVMTGRFVAFDHPRIIAVAREAGLALRRKAK
jgi:hypothetical protein